MQKLVWQNANGDSIDLTSGNYGITQWEGFSNTSLNIQSQQVPFQDGAVFLDALLNQRELSVTLKMQDNGNLEERYRMRRELIHILNPKLGEGYLIYTNDFISKRIKCVAQVPLFETHNSDTRGTPKASLSWAATNPYWEDLEETEVNINENNIIKSVFNNGEVKTYPNIELCCNCQNPIIYNQETNKKIELVGNIQENIIIKTEQGKKEIYTQYPQLKYFYYNYKDILTVGNNYILLTETGIFVYNNYYQLLSVYSKTNINSIIYINGIYYICGKNGIVEKSVDCINWNLITVPTNKNLNKIKYENNIFYITGDEGILLTSNDGINWSLISTNISYNLLDIIYGNNLYLIITNNYSYKTSDLISFSTLTNKYEEGIFFENKFYTIYKVNSRDTELYSSINLIDWNDVTFGSVGSHIFKLEEYLIFSSYILKLIRNDTVEKTIQNELSTDFINGVYLNNRYLFIGNNKLCMSNTLEDWMYIDRSLTSNFSATKYKSYYGKAYCVSSSGFYIFTENGWEKIGPTLICSDFIITEKGAYLCSGKKIYYSKNYTININNFVEIATLEFDTITSIQYINGKIYVMGSYSGFTGHYESEDGINFQPVQDATASNFLNIFFVNNYYFCITYNGINIKDKNFNNINYLSTTGEVNSMAYGGNRYIFFTKQKKIYLSTNLSSLEEISYESPDGYSIKNVVFYKNYFFIIDKQIAILSFNNIFTTILTPFDTANAINENSFISAYIENDEIIIYSSNGKLIKINMKKQNNIINKITSDSNLDFEFISGNNNLIITSSLGKLVGLVTYRQKYLGV